MTHLKILGIKIARAKRANACKGTTALRYRVLCNAIVRLYKKLGEPVDGELHEVWKLCNGPD